jgi:hypothetical protein
MQDRGPSRVLEDFPVIFRRCGDISFLELLDVSQLSSTCIQRGEAMLGANNNGLAIMALYICSDTEVDVSLNPG